MHGEIKLKREATF